MSVSRFSAILSGLRACLLVLAAVLASAANASDDTPAAGCFKILLGDLHSLVGREQVPPHSQMFRYLLAEIQRIRSLRDLPPIPYEDFSLLKPIPGAGGNGNKAVLEGSLHDARVALKVLDRAKRSESALIREALWLITLNKLGLGVEFRGVTHTPEGDPALVLEYLDGVKVPLSPGHRFPPGFQVTPGMLREILAAGRLLQAAGIRYTRDLQFMLTRDGHARIIDPEFFSWSIPADHPPGVPFSPLEISRRIASSLSPLVRRSMPDARDEDPPQGILYPP
jgi:hypothetical protein